MNRLYLVRHGENEANITKEFSYRKVDFSLNAKGVLQAEQTAAFLSGEGIDEVYSSPLKRSLETAEIIARPLGLELAVLEELRELNVGTLEDGPPTPEKWGIFTHVMADWLHGKPQTSFPGGEDLRQLLARAGTAFAEIVAGKDDKRSVVVGHGGIFTFALVNMCLDLDLSVLKNESQNCSISQIEAELVDGVVRARLLSWASHDHLSGAAAELVSPLPEPGTSLAAPANA